MTPHQLNTFAYRLKIARKAKRLSQEKLGILAGIDENSASARMNQYERGKHIPDFLMMGKIATTLDVPVAYFYAEDDHLAEAILLFSKLNPTDQQNVLTYIKDFSHNTG